MSKILIVAPSRTGGRVLSKWLSLELNCLWIHEPFHFHNESFIKNIDDLTNYLNRENFIMKVNYGDWTKYYSDYIFFSFFNKIICLTIDNVFETAISYTKALSSQNFTKKYELEKNWIENNFTEILSNQEYLKDKMERTKLIKDSLQITYEGVYHEKNDIKKIQDYLNITEFEHVNMLNNNLRYRNQKQNII